MIKSQYPEVYSDMSFMVLGSTGLGIEDADSDIEAAIYLEDNLWRVTGKQLQLDLNRLLEETNRWKKKGSILCVHPISWVLDGKAKQVQKNPSEIPWEDISIETLFTIQKNMIIVDQNKVLSKLREYTTEQNYPQNLWKKAILTTLKQFILEDAFEFQKCVKRNHIAEASITYGKVIEDIYHIAFLVSKKYYPWRTHLNWAYKQLPLVHSELTGYLDSLFETNNWQEKQYLISQIETYFRTLIHKKKLLPEIDLFAEDLENELIWSERLGAWEHPDWRDYVKDKAKQAIAHGYNSDQFWVFSLWQG